MPDLTGNVRDIGGVSMVGKQVELIFTLNAPNVVATGPWTGRLVPTEPVSVTPDALGEYTITLTDTTSFINEAWYTLSIRWIRPGGPTEQGYAPIDFPGWRISVPSIGGMLQDLITDSSGKPAGPNNSLVWVGLTPPPNPRPNTFWLVQNPDQLDDPLNTSVLYQWGKIS